jgi:anaphase-promoting complex subunit 8
MDASSNMSGMSMSMSMDTASYSYSPHPPRTPQRYTDTKSSKEKWDLEEARIHLRNATTILSHRGLKLASRWAAEHLNSLAQPSTGASSVTATVPSHHLELNTMGSDLEMYAKSIFDLAEYHRAAAILSVNPRDDSELDRSHGTGKRRVSTKGGDLTIYLPRDSLTTYGIYLRAYALYMAGERRKEEEVLELR